MEQTLPLLLGFPIPELLVQTTHDYLKTSTPQWLATATEVTDRDPDYCWFRVTNEDFINSTCSDDFWEFFTADTKDITKCDDPTTKGMRVWIEMSRIFEILKQDAVNERNLSKHNLDYDYSSYKISKYGALINPHYFWLLPPYKGVPMFQALAMESYVKPLKEPIITTDTKQGQRLSKELKACLPNI